MVNRLLHGFIAGLFAGMFFGIAPVACAEELALSEAYGVVKDSYTAEDSPYTVYFIRDAHCHYEAQLNISKIISYLVHTHNVGLITVEGAADEINPIDLRQFPYEETRRMVSEYFMKSGRINGVEYYSITASNPPVVRGIEDRELYCENYSCLSTALKNGGCADIFTEIAQQMRPVKKTVYSQEIAELEALEEDYEAGAITFQSFLEQLITFGKESGAYSDKYANLDLCLELITLEKSLSLPVIEQERARLVRQITETMSQEEVNNFLQENLKFRLNKISYQAYLSYVFDQAQRFLIDISPYTQLSAYKKYLQLHAAINQDTIFEESQQLAESMFDVLCQNPEQRRVHDISSQLALLKKAFQLQVSSREWAKLAETAPFFTSSDDIALLESYNPSVFSSSGALEQLNAFYPVIEKFYTLAEERDAVLVQNLLKQMQNTRTDKAIVVAGGYHSSGITRKLREQGISYHVISARITETDDTNPYASLVLGTESKWADFFLRTWGSLALASWLEPQPLVNPRNHYVFGNMFKSLMLSTLAWQLAGYDISSIRELNMPILRGVQEKLNEVARNVGYDMRVIELTRVKDQLYVRLTVADQEIVYGLFAQKELVDWQQIASAEITPGNILSEFQLLGGSVLVLTADQYEGILTTVGRSILAQEQSSETMVRTLLTHQISENIIQVRGLSDLQGNTLESLSDVAARIIAFLQDELSITEEQRAVEEYLESYVQNAIARQRLRIDDQTGEIVLSPAMEKALVTAELMLEHADGRLVRLAGPERELAFRDESVQFLFASSTIPLEVIARFWSKLEQLQQEGDIDKGDIRELLVSGGTIDLGMYGDENFTADLIGIASKGPTPDLCAVMKHAIRRPLLQQLDDTYSQLLGEDAITVTAGDTVALSFDNVSGTRKSIVLQRIIPQSDQPVMLSPRFGMDIENPHSVDKAIQKMQLWKDKNNIPIHRSISTIDAKYTQVNNLLMSIFAPLETGLNEFEQFDAFRAMLRAFTYAANNRMDYSLNILSGQIVEVLKGNNPRLRVISQIINGQRAVQGLALNQAEKDLVYHIYLHSIQYDTANIDLNEIDPSLLARLLQDVYIEDASIEPDSVQEKLLTKLRGGKYFTKLDMSALAADNGRDKVEAIFQDAVSLDTAFANAGIPFENIRKIQVYRSRFQGFVSDYRVLLETYQGTRRTVRLRVLNNDMFQRLFAWHVDAMERFSHDENSVFPDIYLVHTSTQTKANYYIAEHVDGMIGDRIDSHPDQFTDNEKMVFKFKGAQSWMRFWGQAVTPQTQDDIDAGYLEQATIVTPTLIGSLIFPEDGSDPKILGVGYSMQPDASTFFELLFKLSMGFELQKKDHILILANAVIATFGWERGQHLLLQAFAEARESYRDLMIGKNDVNSDSLYQMISYLMTARKLMQRDSVKKYIDIAYNGDSVRAFVDIAEQSLNNGNDPLAVLRGQFTQWDEKMPSPGEVKQELRRRRPSILTVTGGTGGNSLINAIKNIEDTSMVNLVTTFDTGGQSYVWQDVFDPLVGYSYSKGDVTNVAVAYLDEAKQDLMNKRLPADTDIDAIYPIVHELIQPSLDRFPELKDDPAFLIDFIDAIKKIDELIAYLREKHREDPARFRNPDLRKASLKNLFIEALNFYSRAYNVNDGRFDLDQAAVAEDLLHRLLGIDRGIVVPLATQEGDLVARLKTPLPRDAIPSLEAEMSLGTKIQRNKISEDGTAVYGEHYIGEIGEFHENIGSQIDYIDIVTHPDDQIGKPQLSPRAAEALQYPTLDLILVGPGSLYTSLLPHFTLKDFVLNLINRGKSQTVVYPNNQRVEIEPAKRVFIVNPVYSFEDKGMTVTDIITMIERTAQKATGNPNLRFTDMFDAVVVNDPSKSSEKVKEYIRKKKMDVIQPTRDDIEYLESQGLDVYPFDLATIQSRPTRTPGFDLQYAEKLEYSADKIKLITNMFLDSTRHHKKQDRLNIGIGTGHHAPGEFDRVKRIIKSGEVKPVYRNHQFYTQGLKWLEGRAHLLGREIERTDDETEKDMLRNDLELLEKVIESIKSNTMALYSVQPQSGSQGIFVDNAMHYQFAAAIPTDERGLNHGMYFSATLIELIENYREQALIAESVGKYEISDSYMNKIGSIAAEALFHQFGMWVLSEEQGRQINPARVQLELQRINETRVGLPSPLYGTILYDELAKMASKEVVETSLEESEHMAGIPDDISLDEKIKRVKELVDLGRRADRIKASLIKVSNELADKLEVRLSLIGTQQVFDPVVSSDEVRAFLRQHSIDSVELMSIDFAEHLRNIHSILAGEVTQEKLEDWVSRAHVIRSLLSVVNQQLGEHMDDVEFDEFPGYTGMSNGLIELNNLIVNLDALIRSLRDNPGIPSTMTLLNKVSIFQLEEMHRELTLQRDLLPPSLIRRTGEVPLDILERRDMLSTMQDADLREWMTNMIVTRATDNIPAAQSDLKELIDILVTFIENYPMVRESYENKTILEQLSPQEKIVLERLFALERIAQALDLDSYSGIRHFLHSLEQVDMRNMLIPAIEHMVPAGDRKQANFFIIMRQLTNDLMDRIHYIEQAIESVRIDFPRAFSRFEYGLHRDGKLPGRNIGLGDGHHGENPARVNTLLASSDVTRISMNDPLLKGVTDYIRRTALDLMVSSKDMEPRQRQTVQDAAMLFSRIHGLLENEQYRVWTVEPPDGNPALYIDDAYTYQFAAVRNHDIYFAKGLIDRLRFLWDQGQHHMVIGMLAESIVHEIGETIFEEELGDRFDLEMAHQTMREYGFYLSQRAPVIDLEAEPESLLYREMQTLAGFYLVDNNIAVQDIPLFTYPSDIPRLRNTLREQILKGTMSNTDFLDLLAAHFELGISLGAPAEMMYNNAYYHPGEVLGFVREFTLPEIRGREVVETHGPFADKVIGLSKTDDFSKQKAREVINMLLTHERYADMIGRFSPHELEDMMYDIIRVITADDDPYQELKDDFNQRALDALSDMDRMIDQQDDPVMAAALVAIAGNALDFADMTAFEEISTGGFSFVDEIGRILQPDTHIAKNDFSYLLERLGSKPNQTIVYAIDNAGEIITDFPLLKRLMSMGHKIVLVTRDKHTANDVSYEDALKLFDRQDVRSYFTDSSGKSYLPEQFDIIHSGSNVTGTDLRRATPEFVRTWQNADIRLLKGQGNYETLRYYPMKQDMFFLVKVKDPLATARVYEKGDVLVEYRSLNPLVGAYIEGNMTQIERYMRNDLTAHERALVAEFLVFYLDHLATQADLFNADGNTRVITEMFAQARDILTRASSVPAINTELLGILHRKLRNESPISEFLREFTEPRKAAVRESNIPLEQYMIIDFDAIPSADLSYVYETISSIDSQRTSDITVRWVIFSDSHSVGDMMEELLRRKFYRPGMDIIGRDRIDAIAKQQQITGENKIKKIVQVISHDITAQPLDSRSVKILTANDVDAAYSAINSLMVVKLDSQGTFSQITDFITGLISLDSLIHGGKIPDLQIIQPKTGEVYQVSDMLNLQGSVSSTNLAGSILSLRPAAPVKEQLKRLEHRRVLENAI